MNNNFKYCHANSMETYSRRDNLIIYGIKEPANESAFLCQKAVRQLFVDQLKFSDAEAAAVPFVKCHRLYDRRATRKSSIVRFQNFSDRERVWSEKTSFTDKFVRLGEDFPKQISTRLLGGFGGMLPREIFLKWCNLVRFREYFAKILSKKNN